MGCHVDTSERLCLAQKLSLFNLHHCTTTPQDLLPLPFPQDHHHTNSNALFSLGGEDSVGSQDFLCMPDFITPIEQQFSVDFEGNKVTDCCVHSPTKSSSARSKRPRPEIPIKYPTSFETSALEDVSAVASNTVQTENEGKGPLPSNFLQRSSAIYCQVLSPPCAKNIFLSQDREDMLFEDKRLQHPSKARLMPILGANCLSRYREEFHEIQEIGRGNFSIVYKVLKRIDGCFYAVKRSRHQLCHDNERKRAITEVQALAAIGYHENIVRYYTAWFESNYLYIQMELCEGSLGTWKHAAAGSAERFLLDAMYQVSQALAFIHSHGIAHLDVKPENIFRLGRTFKLGDFGRATRLDGSIVIDEGDGRYMPLEILNDDYSHIPKADMFALGASMYELARGFPLPSSGSQFQALRQGKLSLLPGFSLHFQKKILKNLMHPNPLQRPSAQDLLAILRCS